MNSGWPTQHQIPIRHLRGVGVIIDADLARLYGVSTKVLNQAVRRNQQRFPDDFRFQLTSDEKEKLVTTCDHLRSLRFARALPFAYTEHGALMGANVLHSPQAIRMSVLIIRAFIRHRERLAANADILKRLAEVDHTLLLHDNALRDIYEKLLPLLEPPPEPPKRRIGFA